MTLNQLHTFFDVELDKSNISGYPSFLPEEKDYFINLSIRRFYKTRYSGNNNKQKGFQQDQKRSDDFRNIVKTEDILKADMTVSDNEYIASYPSDYWIMLGETSTIKYSDDSLYKNKNVDVLECTIENIDSRLNNSLSEHILRRGYARPLRVFKNDKIYLYTDGQYDIEKYSVTYIKKPQEVDWYSNNTDQLTIVPDHAWDEIISGAVRSAMENISDIRYQTYSIENQGME